MQGGDDAGRSGLPHIGELDDIVGAEPAPGLFHETLSSRLAEGELNLDGLFWVLLHAVEGGARFLGREGLRTSLGPNSSLGIAADTGASSRHRARQSRQILSAHARWIH